MYEGSDLAFRLVDMSMDYAWRGVQQHISAFWRMMMNAVVGRTCNISDST